MTRPLFGQIHLLWMAGVMFVSALLPITARADAASLLVALNELKSHISGTVTLTAAEIGAQKLTIDANEASFASSSAIISASLELVRAYDAVLGPLWVARTLPARDSVTNDIHFTTYTVMQNIMDLTYKSATLASYESLLNGFKFGSSANFPGACNPPADPNAVLTATLSASYLNSFGRATFMDGAGTYARKPTGCYLAPGSIATITVPAAMVGTGYRIRVGAHSWDFSNKADFKRLDRASLVYSITAATTKIASPLGGGIYIEVPFLANAGVVSVQLKNAVRSPYFSAKSFHTTTPVQWLAEREHAAPWADFQTDKFMMQVPTSWISAMPDPTKLMQDWDAAMDACNDLMGHPRIRGKETVYPQVDVLIRSAAYSPGYPSVNNTYSPGTNYGGYASSHLVRGPQNAPYWELHEQGHAYLFEKFPGEVESTVNLLHVPTLHLKFGNTLNQAFYKSSGGYTSVGTLNNTAVAWMACFNFVNGVAMEAVEKQYQLKGHAKFADTARLFGWGKVNKYFKSFNDDFEASVTIGTTVDSLLLRLSKNVGTDMRPLFRFWGVPPINNTTLGASIAAANLPASAAIYDALVQYKALVPADNAAFRTFTTTWWGGTPLLTGFQEENEHAQQLDTYNAASATALQAKVQSIINLYFPGGRPADVILPAVLSTSPADGAFGFSTTGNLVVTFTEPIVVGTGNVTIKNLTDGTQSTVAITSAQATVSGAVLTINPSANLTSGKTYAIRLDATAIDDAAGNSFAGIADDTTWTFTTSTPDTTAPTLTNFSPADDATNAPRNATLVVTFSEPIDVGTGNITIKNLTDATQSTIAITSAQVTVSGSVLFINPTADLTSGKAYAIQIAATAIDDLAGNSFAGIANDTTWNFTAVTPDTTAPTTFFRSPANNATGVSNIANLVLTLNEPIKTGPGYITLKNLTDGTQSLIPASYTTQATVAGSVLTINPTQNFAPGKTYAIRIDPTAIDDLAGNSFAGIANDTTWTFTISTIAILPPTLSIINPTISSITLADAATTLHLEASVTSQSGTPTVAWSLVEGPGTVTFSAPTLAQTSASFSAAGTYTLQCAATNTGGTSIERVGVGVAAPAKLELRQEADGYQHAATFIRGDSTSWNSGARDQVLLGQVNSEALRALFSFELSLLDSTAVIQSASLDLWTISSAGVGTVGNVELRALTGTPVEGTGDGITATNGAGTGATWLSRTGSVLWANAGGNFGAAVLSSVPGFDATVPLAQKTFTSSAGFVAAVQSAVNAGTPLNLIALSPTTEAGASTAYSRIQSDDSTTEAQRPRLTLTFLGHPAPSLSANIPPVVTRTLPAALGGSASPATASLWSSVSGPGVVTFTDATAPGTTAVFSQPGSYLLRLTATNSRAQTSRTFAVTVLTHLETWRNTYFGSTTNTDLADSNGDGELNLMEFATGQNPNAATRTTPALVKNGATLEFTYTRSLAAMSDAVTFTAEWSDTLATWSSAGVTELILTNNGTVQTVKASVAAGSEKRFARLKMTRP